ncbi:hypothetical protein F2Q68_00029633 [Brassica cretica]|uniref:Uncharacterized protein n=1 Tax=Brassica cretica TaxID=69181 RepID=A0A8S9GDV1_BRACR|nr:hypothetical protein F2Q68_00029633 [Brassica cretica]
MPKRRLHPFRPLYSWLLLWSFFVLQKRRTEHLNRINGFGSSCGECCSPMINRGTVMVSLVGIFLVHLLHGFILPPGNSTGGRLLIIENRRSLSFMPYGDVRSLSISYVVLAWIIHVIRNKLVISVKNPLIFHDVQSTKLRFMKGIEYTFLRYLWYIEWRIWDPGITNSKRRVGSRPGKIKRTSSPVREGFVDARATSVSSPPSSSNQAPEDFFPIAASNG